MATFEKVNGKVQQVWTRFPLAADQFKYVRQPFNIVRYDDNSGEYIEPVNTGPTDYTWTDQYPQQEKYDFLIVDVAPGAGVTEIR